MKYLIKTNDYVSLETVDYGRVVYDSANDKVFLQYRGGGEEVNPSQSVACDLCFYDKQNDKVIIVSGKDWSIETYPADRYTPIGVVVVPGIHDVYGDGSCGVMSLKQMNSFSPDSGQTYHQGMCWGGSGNDLSLPNLNQIPTGNTSNGIPTGLTNSGYLPSDKFSGIQCAHDTDVFYYNMYSQAPSPYLTNGSRNPGYYQTTPPSSSNNVLADFDGIGNSQVIWDLATSQSNWKTASTITNDSGSGYYPAACCCWRYHTEGTYQGDWYLPACGELGYIMPPFNKINDAIDKLCTVYGSSVGSTLYNGIHASSTESTHSSIFGIDTLHGNVSYSSKDHPNYYVRAFLRVGGGE